MREFRFHIFISLFLLFFSFAGSYIYGVDPAGFDKNMILAPPSLEAPFGCDRLGRDMLSRVMEGFGSSIIVGVLAAAVSTFLSLMIGVSAGFYRGAVDKTTVALIDLFLTVPTFFLLLALVAYIEVSPLFLAGIIAISSWMGTARLLRSEAYAINDKPFIKILKIAKVKDSKIILKYYAPLLSPILATSFVFGVSGAILAESSLSFLGLGIMPPDMSLGSLLADGKDVMDIAWWVSFFPGLMIFLITYTLIDASFKLQNKINKKTSAV